MIRLTEHTKEERKVIIKQHCGDISDNLLDILVDKVVGLTDTPVFNLTSSEKGNGQSFLLDRIFFCIFSSSYKH